MLTARCWKKSLGEGILLQILRLKEILPKEAFTLSCVWNIAGCLEALSSCLNHEGVKSHALVASLNVSCYISPALLVSGLLICEINKLSFLKTTL